ncbi:hypothetical protein [Streptomyces sp. NPDC019507]|uniref:hypothetical protein n=1 Tax=Streptomyces sp. NPDC019507 TaxID=3154689 RepID=UPI00340E6CF7
MTRMPISWTPPMSSARLDFFGPKKYPTGNAIRTNAPATTPISAALMASSLPCAE